MGKTRDKYIQDVRTNLLDFARLNRLLDDEEELDDTQLGFCLDKALDRYNTMPPPIPSATFEGFPSDSVLIDLAMAEALRMAWIHRGRNSLTYTSDGTTVALDNFREYEAMMKDQRAEAISNAKELKISINIKRGFGKVHTPYRYSG